MSLYNRSSGVFPSSEIRHSHLSGSGHRRDFFSTCFQLKTKTSSINVLPKYISNYPHLSISMTTTALLKWYKISFIYVKIISFFIIQHRVMFQKFKTVSFLCLKTFNGSSLSIEDPKVLVWCIAPLKFLLAHPSSSMSHHTEQQSWVSYSAHRVSFARLASLSSAGFILTLKKSLKR